MGSHAGDFFERFIKKAVIRIANLGADLRDGERGIGEKLAGRSMRICCRYSTTPEPVAFLKRLER